jgi:hypothetical protein
MLKGADLSDARITQDQLDEACADSTTRLPRGLTARACHGVVIRRITIPKPPAPPAAPRWIISAAE